MKMSEAQITECLRATELPDGIALLDRDGQIVWPLPEVARQRSEDRWIVYLICRESGRNFVYHFCIEEGIQPWELKRLVVTSVRLFREHRAAWRLHNPNAEFVEVAHELKEIPVADGADDKRKSGIEPPDGKPGSGLDAYDTPSEL